MSGCKTIITFNSGRTVEIPRAFALSISGRCKTIITFNSGRTAEITGDWVDDLAKMNGITQFQTFLSDDGKRWDDICGEFAPRGW